MALKIPEKFVPLIDEIKKIIRVDTDYCRTLYKFFESIVICENKIETFSDLLKSTNVPSEYDMQILFGKACKYGHSATASFLWDYMGPFYLSDDIFNHICGTDDLKFARWYFSKKLERCTDVGLLQTNIESAFTQACLYTRQQTAEWLYSLLTNTNINIVVKYRALDNVLTGRRVSFIKWFFESFSDLNIENLEKWTFGPEDEITQLVKDYISKKKIQI